MELRVSLIVSGCGMAVFYLGWLIQKGARLD